VLELDEDEDAEIEDEVWLVAGFASTQYPSKSPASFPS
jgi:hypothetical protein